MSAIVIAGANGFMGRHLRTAFAREGLRVRTIGRHAQDDAGWDGELRRVLDGAEALINLAGRSVSCRYTKENADAIFTSRVATTRALADALTGCAQPPPTWINASTGTIYRDARDHAQDESGGELGSGFSVEVARAWERELDGAPDGVRAVAIRTAIVLGSGGGALNPLINLARLGFGGRQGDGAQMVSWIHIEDVHGAIRHILDTPGLASPVNLASPEPVTNAELMAQVRRQFGGSLGARSAIPLPARALAIGGRVIRTEPELVLKSRWVHPAALVRSGYTFTYRHLDQALAQIARETPRGLLRVQLG